MFDGIFGAMIVLGAILGLSLAGVIWFVSWLCCHIKIVWVP